MSHAQKKLRRSVRGFTMVELLCALTINTVLLVGLGLSVHAASRTIQLNNDTARSTQSARATLQRMLTEARTCFEPIVTTTTFNLKPENYDERRTYAFEPEARRITMTIHQGLPGIPDPVVTVVRDVSSANFYSDGRVIAITLVIGSGESAVTLLGSAIPRRFVSYE